MGWFSDIWEDAKDFAEDLFDAAVDLFQAAVDLVLSPFGIGQDIPDFADNQTEQNIVGPLLNKSSGVGDIPVVYGKRRVGGFRVFVSTNGSTNQYLYVAIVLSEGQVNSFEKLYIDDEEVALSSYAHGTTATPSSGRYSDRVQVQFFDGRDDQTVSSILDAAPNWGSNHRLRGLAYLALRFEWKKIESQEDADNNPFRSGVPRVNAIIEGKKVLDVTGITPASYNTAYASDTLAYTTNPVSVLVDYCRNSRYGKGLSNDVFDWASFKLVAQQCDQTVPYTTSTTGKAYEFDGVVSTSNSLMNNIRQILAVFRGIMPYQQGQYFLKMEHGGDDTDIDATPSDPTTVMTITEDDMIGGLNIRGESKDRKITQLRVTYTDPSADYQPNDVLFPDDNDSLYTTFLNQDGVALTKNMTLPYCVSRERALNYASITVKNSRSNQLISFRATPKANDLSVGDLIRVTNSNLNFDGIFRVAGLVLTPDGDVGISAQQHNASDYGLSGHSAEAARPTIALPDPFTVNPPTSVTVTSSGVANSNGYFSISQMKVAFTASVDPFVTEYIVQFKLAADSAFTTAGITNDTEFFIDNVTSGQQYDVRVATRNELDRRSNFANATRHTVA